MVEDRVVEVIEMENFNSNEENVNEIYELVAETPKKDVISKEEIFKVSNSAKDNHYEVVNKEPKGEKVNEIYESVAINAKENCKVSVGEINSTRF